MIFKLINKLEKSGDLKRLADAGIVSTKLFTYREIYMEYDKNLRIGMNKMEAVHKTSINMRVCQSLIYRAKNMMERNAD